MSPDSGNEKLLNALFSLCHTKFRLELHVLFACCTSTVGSHLSEHDQEELGMLKQHYLTKQSSFHLMHSKIPISISLENVEHCGGEPERADPGILCH